jgi:hypothetical protein
MAALASIASSQSASPVSYSASSAKGRVWRSIPASGYAAERRHRLTINKKNEGAHLPEI